MAGFGVWLVKKDKALWDVVGLPPFRPHAKFMEDATSG